MSSPSAGESEAPVLRDDELLTGRSARTAVAAVRSALAAAASSDLVSPARHGVDVGDGSLVFTVGGTPALAGFRVYDTFNNSPQDQIVAVWDRSNGHLRGLAVGTMLGALRTGAIGAVAVDRLAPRDTPTCAVIGAGLQARMQLLCAATVRELREVRVVSRTAQSRDRFIEEMAHVLPNSIELVAADSTGEAVEGASLILSATNSATPVVRLDDLAGTVHVNTVGPKTNSAHELDPAIAAAADRIVTDAPAQIESQPNHFLRDTEAWDRIENLATAPPRDDENLSLFLSAGLAGTEPMVLSALIDAGLGKDKHA